jgi:hypothetical protein
VIKFARVVRPRFLRSESRRKRDAAMVLSPRKAFNLSSLLVGASRLGTRSGSVLPGVGPLRDRK